MTPEELVAHIKATSEQYRIDANALRESGWERDTNLARYFEGKSDGYHVAACWIEEYVLGI